MKKYRDFYFKKAKKENYPARSVYKLKEMDKAFKLFSPGQKVLDLGASPGSWSLYAAQKVGPKGHVVAVDLNPPGTTFPEQVSFVQADVFTSDTHLQEVLEQYAPFDLIISDMAPKTTGIKFTDQARSYNLAEQALSLARNWLKAKGHFVVKIFLGPDVPNLVQEMRKSFTKVKQFKPKSSRSESKEMFLVGLGYKKS
ncbi:RlmE family RNA methyltransferase [Desulfohalobiaceae bacterium Ax17]|uniref:RlmE family RNA methyltransferase n=1 Tax=Desulfovulcanus ferrireducens TaxID=2831190 RepID=UPI00207BB30F|nr:RlmE family RNA methyltransferase [Desulfovulcanus ferrireducens]MBT8764520.1 RlmE family RNA methyltransferase [Desulfovulcanus ferrireducens]